MSNREKTKPPPLSLCPERHGTLSTSPWTPRHLHHHHQEAPPDRSPQLHLLVCMYPGTPQALLDQTIIGILTWSMVSRVSLDLRQGEERRELPSDGRKLSKLPKLESENCCVSFLCISNLYLTLLTPYNGLSSLPVLLLPHVLGDWVVEELVDAWASMCTNQSEPSKRPS